MYKILRLYFFAIFCFFLKNYSFNKKNIFHFSVPLISIFLLKKTNNKNIDNFLLLANGINLIFAAKNNLNYLKKFFSSIKNFPFNFKSSSNQNKNIDSFKKKSGNNFISQENLFKDERKGERENNLLKTNNKNIVNDPNQLNLSSNEIKKNSDESSIVEFKKKQILSVKLKKNNLLKINKNIFNSNNPLFLGALNDLIFNISNQLSLNLKKPSLNISFSIFQKNFNLNSIKNLGYCQIFSTNFNNENIPFYLLNGNNLIFNLNNPLVLVILNNLTFSDSNFLNSITSPYQFNFNYSNQFQFENGGNKKLKLINPYAIINIKNSNQLSLLQIEEKQKQQQSLVNFNGLNFLKKKVIKNSSLENNNQNKKTNLLKITRMVTKIIFSYPILKFYEYLIKR